MTELIREGYDLHCHLLWNVDDGSRSRDMSMELLESEYSQGVRHICITPHFIPGPNMVTKEQIQPFFNELKELAASRWLDLRLYLGQELAWDASLPAALERGLACTMAGTSYVLVEFMPGAGMKEVQYALDRLLREGYRPIVAHMERVPAVAAKGRLVEELRQMGVLVQINLEDLMGSMFDKEARITRNLVKNELVDVVGTDAHRTDWRPVVYEEPVRWLKSHYDEDYINRILGRNPEAVLKGKKI